MQDTYSDDIQQDVHAMITNFNFKESLLPKDTDKTIVQIFREFLKEIKLALKVKLRNSVDSKAKTFENYYGKIFEDASSI